MTSADKLSEQLQNLWQKHLPLMQSRVATIRVAIDALRQNRPTQEIREAKEAAHKLAGSLGTFGLENASRNALEIERLLTNNVGDRDNGALLDHHLTQIKQAIDSRGR